MHVMLDLETLSTRPNAAIIAIGAVAFDPQRMEVLSTFEARIRPDSADSLGGHVDMDTVSWWMRQPDAVRAQWDDEGAQFGNALSQLHTWLRGNQHGPLSALWGNGAAFDNVVLAEAFRAWAMIRPWSYKQDRCYRTLRALLPHIEEPPFEGERHTALADALHQAKHCMRLLAALRTEAQPNA
ncbi:3'-5' exonuclease [Rhodovarius crocodyli]|nr:3'-5' exonuclease [Rhodovarius crocodyli]